MKNIISSILLISIFGANLGFAQTPCSTPVSTMDYQQMRRSVSGQTSSFQKLQAAVNAVKGNCVSTTQLMDLMNLFADDGERLELANSALPNITNKNDIYDVYNSFAYFGTALRFYDKVHNRGGGQMNNDKPKEPIVRQAEIVFPQWNYPNVNTYSGYKNCNTSLADGDFGVYIKDVAARTTEMDKKSAALQLAQNMCLSTAQAMKLSSLLGMEVSRLEVLQTAYLKIYDEGNFGQAVQAFNHPPNQSMFNEWLNAQRNARIPAKPICVVTEEQFKGVFDAIHREAFSSDKIDVAKNMIPKYKCYTSVMAKRLVSDLMSSSDQLDMAKLVYDYVGDKENFYQEVSTVFSFSSDRKALSNFVASKGN